MRCSTSTSFAAARRGWWRAPERLDVTVRWVHALELTDIRRLLRGGELVLSTGIALPESAAGLAEYVAALADVGIAGLAVELGRRYADALPDRARRPRRRRGACR